MIETGGTDEVPGEHTHKSGLIWNKKNRCFDLKPNVIPLGSMIIGKK